MSEWQELPTHAGETDKRTRLERLLNFKRYIDWLVNLEIEKSIKRAKKVKQ